VPTAPVLGAPSHPPENKPLPSTPSATAFSPSASSCAPSAARTSTSSWPSTSTATAPPTTSNAASSRKWPPPSGVCAAPGPSKPASTTTPSPPARPATNSAAWPALSPTSPHRSNSPSCIAMRPASTTSASVLSRTYTSSETPLHHQTNPLSTLPHAPPLPRFPRTSHLKIHQTKEPSPAPGHP